MARPRKTDNGIKTADYRHDGEKRTNIPPAKMAGEGEIPKVKKVRYHYSPHLSPELRFDPTGKADRVMAVKEKAGQYLTAKEKELLDQALASQQPWLEWAGKKEQYDRGWFEVDPVALHIHERVSAQAIVRAAMREDLQRDLFADPQLEYQKAVQFYQHDIDWANRLILGDSLQVMSSLARRENLAGKVQMIYIDPPYGISFNTNVQIATTTRQAANPNPVPTGQTEMVKAYRDTWCLGTHSYLTYLRDRLAVARELLTDAGSIFVQIGDENLHRVRAILDELFGEKNFCGLIVFSKNSGATDALMSSPSDYILWFARDRSLVKYNQLYYPKTEGSVFAERYDGVELCTGEKRTRTKEEATGSVSLPEGARLYTEQPAVSQGYRETTSVPFAMNDFVCDIGKQRNWKTSLAGMSRLAKAERLKGSSKMIYFIRCLEDFPAYAMNCMWTDTQDRMAKKYVVETVPRVIQRCMLMTSDPGDLVLDPTCGSGTTAYVAEQWGRRWVTIDTSRVAASIARQRLLTAKYEFFKYRDEAKGVAGGFRYKTVPHITLKSIAQNQNLDPIFGKHEPILLQALDACNKALGQVSDACRSKLKAKLQAKQAAEGKRAITDADERRWNLPVGPSLATSRNDERASASEAPTGFEHWTVPFDTDEDWPKALQEAVTVYRKAWRAKMDEVNRCIEENADQEELVDQPEVVRGILRVSGPFTVEGVRPEELSMGEDGKLFDPTQNDWESDSPAMEPQNISAYLSRMVELIRKDGVTFPNNKHQKFARVEPLYEERTGLGIHAEAIWEGTSEKESSNIAIAFGPQYGPVTAMQVEELIRASRRYDELVIAGFSFDAAATEIIQNAQHPKLKIHMAHIRPDVSPGMDGLLKDTPNSQLFTVFGQPEIRIKKHKDGTVQVELVGVDIYDPLKGEVKSSGADKVAAWFLDGDYDGRCFCITQAFFPDQSAWEKIAKALGSSADSEVFEAFNGTESVPFKPGKHKRVAVKVIDPRGNEVMTVRKLDA